MGELNQSNHTKADLNNPNTEYMANESQLKTIEKAKKNPEFTMMSIRGDISFFLELLSSIWNKNQLKVIP